MCVQNKEVIDENKNLQRSFFNSNSTQTSKFTRLKRQRESIIQFYLWLVFTFIIFLIHLLRNNMLLVAPWKSIVSISPCWVPSGICLNMREQHKRENFEKTITSYGDSCVSRLLRKTSLLLTCTSFNKRSYAKWCDTDLNIFRRVIGSTGIH